MVKKSPKHQEAFLLSQKNNALMKIRGWDHMVTAIVIPIICFYFYWLTKKEMRESQQKWLQLKTVAEEAVISGEIVQNNDILIIDSFMC